MKSSFAKLVLLSSIFLAFTAPVSAGNKNGFGNTNGNGTSRNAGNENLSLYIQSIPSEAVDENEIQAMTFMIEEEKLARDVYLALYEVWGLRVFDNISSSEQTHIDAVALLLDRYGIDNPTIGQEQGVFTDPELQDIYAGLMAKGSLSMIDALEVGATIEDLDIKDLQDKIDITDNEDLTIVFQNLMKGSRNHLRAFVGLLEMNGVQYSAQYLTQEEVDAIVSSDKERGIVDSSGTSIFTPKGFRSGKK